MFDVTSSAESWRPISGYPNYEVSSRGGVRSFARKGGRTVVRGDKPHYLTPQKNNGYLRVFLAGHKPFLVHRLVLDAFAGPCPDGMEACHGNGVRSDNRWPENLRWDTPQSNQADKHAHGTSNRGERHALARLSEAAVKLLRYLHVVHEVPPAELARWFPVSPGCIDGAVYGKKWKHVPMQEAA